MGGKPTTEVRRRVIEAQLPSVIERLRRSASRSGIVSHRAFALEADRLGLTSLEQQRRLRDGLAAVGLRLQRTGRKRYGGAVADSAAASTARSDAPAPRPRGHGSVTPGPLPGPTEAAARLAQARRMLARYADAEGKVGKLAHEGVVRLHGLAPGEARELAVDFPVNRPGLPSAVAHVPIGGVTARSARATSSGGATTTPPAGRKREARSAAFSPLDAGLVDAVRAARAVLDEDRWRREVSRVVLKADEEVGLAVLLRGGTDLSRDVPEGEIAALPHDSERRRAYECLALHNQRLVRRIAQGHRGRKLDIEDLVQHGSIGLLGAVRRFDATRGNKFATYATACIEKAIVQAIADESPLVRLPKDVRERVGKVAKAERRLSGEGRALTVDNVAYVSGLTFAEVEEARRIRQPAGPARRPPIRVR